MSLRSFLSAAFFPLVSGAAVSALALVMLQWTPGGKSWIPLEMPDTVPGRELDKRLREAGIVSVSAFSTTVLLNDFDVIRDIPLDRYGEYVEPGDPRNDGYAERLRNFFIAGGKCRFFLQTGFWGRRGLLKRLGPLLADISPEPSAHWTLGNPGAAEFPALSCAVFIIAAMGFILSETRLLSPLFRRFFGRTETVFPFGAAAAVFVLFPLALEGAGGLLAAGLFAVLFHTLKPVLREYFRQYRKNFRRTTGKEYRELAGLYPFHCAAALCFLPAYILCCVSGGIGPVTAVPLPVLFAVSLFLSYKAESSVERNAFFPQPIRRAFSPRALIHPAAPVFAAGFLAALLFRPAALPAEVSGPYAPFPGPEAYAAHAAFQEAFSVRPLHGGGGEYGTYTLGEDGLIESFQPAIPAQQTRAKH